MAQAPQRQHLVGRRMAQTKPGTLLRRQIPALVGSWKAEDIPGYLEIDLVSHSGEYAAGTFLYTSPRPTWPPDGPSGSLAGQGPARRLVSFSG